MGCKPFFIRTSAKFSSKILSRTRHLNFLKLCVCILCMKSSNFFNLNEIFTVIATLWYVLDVFHEFLSHHFVPRSIERYQFAESKLSYNPCISV